jgi:hypothetical protein
MCNQTLFARPGAQVRMSIWTPLPNCDELCTYWCFPLLGHTNAVPIAGQWTVDTHHAPHTSWCGHPMDKTGGTLDRLIRVCPGCKTKMPTGQPIPKRARFNEQLRFAITSGVGGCIRTLIPSGIGSSAGTIPKNKNGQMGGSRLLRSTPYVQVSCRVCGATDPLITVCQF